MASFANASRCLESSEILCIALQSPFLGTICCTGDSELGLEVQPKGCAESKGATGEPASFGADTNRAVPESSQGSLIEFL